MTTEEKIAVAQASAQEWLVIIDNAKYINSWSIAAPYFQNTITVEQWETTLQGFRQPLGKTISREITSQQYATSLPGTPDGEYVVMQYQTSFEHKQSALETVTSMLEADGTWKVAGYFIK